jgi:glyoxylase-like metal-dependent hydrolase (beta-lactamase superfamily II)
MRKTFTLLTMAFLFTGALLHAEPAQSARRVDLQPMAFVTYIHYPYQEDAAAVLVDSIRTWGGEYRDDPIYAVLTDPRASGLRLKDKNVQLVPLELDESVRNYPFAAKAYAAVIDFLKSRGARPTPLEFETFRLAEKVHRIAYPWGIRNNIIVFSGPDGILLVDIGFSKHAVDALKKTIGGLARGEIKYVVNTHPHGDHIEGNGIAPSKAKVIGFQNLDGPEFKNLISKSGQPLRGRAGRELQAPYVMPFNGEDIQIILNPDLHSQSDILIYFPKSEVLCMGDLHTWGSWSRPIPMRRPNIGSTGPYPTWPSLPGPSTARSAAP